MQHIHHVMSHRTASSLQRGGAKKKKRSDDDPDRDLRPIELDAPGLQRSSGPKEKLESSFAIDASGTFQVALKAIPPVVGLGSSVGIYY